MPENMQTHEWQLEALSETVGSPTKELAELYDIRVPVEVTIFLRCKNCQRTINLKTLLKSKADRDREIDGPCVPRGLNRGNRLLGYW